MKKLILAVAVLALGVNAQAQESNGCRSIMENSWKITTKITKRIAVYIFHKKKEKSSDIL